MWKVSLTAFVIATVFTPRDCRRTRSNPRQPFSAYRCWQPKENCFLNLPLKGFPSPFGGLETI